MSLCPNCNTVNREGVSFCKQCGESLEGTPSGGGKGWACLNCGAILRTGAHFCNQCGSPATNTSQILCSQCGQAVSARSSFCNSCGSRITDQGTPRLCPQCGSPAKPTARFCSHCSTPLDSPSTTPTAMQECPNCGATTRSGVRLCPYCSSSLSAASTLPPAQQPGRFGTGGLLPLTCLAGRYLILEKIAQGGMGAVYKARDQRLQDKIVAVKEMSESAVATSERESVLESFQREAELLARLNHPNLVRVTDRFQEGERHYMVMEFIEGKTFKALLDDCQEPFPEGQVLEWAEQLCDVLDYLHSQDPPIIYRDIKPANVMLVDQTEQVKLIDFGIARFYKPGQRKDTIEFGTDGYAPPEQYGQAQTDERADVYALGVMLHQLLTLRDPVTKLFDFPPVRRLNAKVSRQVSEGVGKAVNTAKADRHQSIEEMWTALSGEELEVGHRQRRGAIPRPAGPPDDEGGITSPASTMDFGDVAVGREVAERSVLLSFPAKERVSLRVDAPWLEARLQNVGQNDRRVVVALKTTRLRPGRSQLQGGILKRLLIWPKGLLIPAPRQIQSTVEVRGKGGKPIKSFLVRVTAVPEPSSVRRGRTLATLAILLEVVVLLGIIASLLGSLMLLL